MLDIQRVMKSKGITRQVLADRLDINPVSVSRLINGNPTIETLNKIAVALEVNLLDLFEDNRQVNNNLKCPNCGTALNINLDVK